MNLDENELLCRKVEGVDVPVAYANAMQLKVHYLALRPASVLANIRAFFPASATEEDHPVRLKI